MIEKILVLLVEDGVVDGRSVHPMLSSLKRGDDKIIDCEVIWKNSLGQALELLQEKPIDLVLLDLELPNGNGLATFLKVRDHCPDTSIVVLTKDKKQCERVRTLENGAQDYLVKGGLSPAALARSMRHATEHSRRLRAERFVKTTQEDFVAAAAIQQRLLPAAAPEIPGLDIAGGCRPAAATGGDYFDFIPMPDDTLGIVVADVSSHGFAPALIMAGIRRVLRTLAEFHYPISEVLKAINRAVLQDTQMEHFVTMFAARLMPLQRTLTYVGAGHEAYILKKTEEVVTLHSTGLPLGVVEKPHLPFGTPVTLEPGDLFVVLTDGFQEAHTTRDGFFGTERVFDLIRNNRHKAAEHIVENLFGAVQEFCRPRSPQDDMTAVVVKCLSN